MEESERSDSPCDSDSKTTNEALRRRLGEYLLVIFTLIVLILMLGYSNFKIYKAYNDLQMQFQKAYKTMEAIQVDKQMSAKKENTAKDNAAFMEEYQKMQGQKDEIIKQIQELKKLNEELATRNKELVSDNIELQNSLKKAAAVGVKPQSFRNFDGINSRGELKRGSYIGRFLGTAYTPCIEECGNNKGITNSGEPIIPGISIAIDNRYWPFGTIFYIKGLGYAVAMDTGGAIKGKYRFDFAVFDKKFADILGQNYWEVYLVKMGNGRIGEVEF